MWFFTLISMNSSAFAGAPAFYHPDDIAAKSAQFAAASDLVGPKFEAGERQVGQLTKAVGRLELGTALLGARAAPDLQAWTTTTRRQLTGQYLRLQRHVELIQGDFSNVFVAALDRALPGITAGKDAVECVASGVAAMMHRTDCVGEDLNGALAAALDKDTKLQADLKDIASVEWPTVTLEPATQPVVAVTGVERYVSLWALGEKFAGARVSERETTLDAALEELAEGLDANDPKAIASAEAARATWAAGTGADGDALMAAAEAAMAKQKAAPAAWGWCANPKLLGGCSGEDVTKEVVELLAADKKFAKFSPP